MRLRHLTTALVTVTIWGTNFVFIQIALQTVTPLWLSALRFVFAALPAIAFVRPPRVPLRTLLLYGLAIFAGQFGLLFSGMKAGVPAGLASLVLQVQVFFTMGLAMWLFGERPQAYRWIGALVAFAGIGVVGLHARGDVSPLGVGLLLLAALSWALGNVSARRAGGANPFALVVWGSAVAVPPLAVLALTLEGTAPLAAAWAGASWVFAGALGYIVYVSTLLAFSLWSTLLRHHAPSAVAPFTLLVPVAGFAGSALILGERLPGWKLGAAALVIAGLALNVFGGRLHEALRRALSPEPKVSAAP
jgi:O-acetylserine/cysteine efflux transporter